MSDETVRKAEKDYSEELNTELPQIEKLSLDQPNEALAKLLAYEKKVRQAADLASSKRVLVAIAQLLTPAKGADNWDELNEQVLLLVKKHGQSKQGIVALVQEVTNRLDTAPNMTTKLATIETLRTITDGRIYLELERARVTQILARLEVSEHQNYAKAAELMGELQVETFGSMEMPEKIDFILEQIALYVKTGDFTYAAIVSRKILTRYFNKASTDARVAAQKIRFYGFKVDIALHDNNYLDVCQNLRYIYDTPLTPEVEKELKKETQQDSDVEMGDAAPASDAAGAATSAKAESQDARSHEILGEMVLFAVLAPHDNLQSDLLHHLARESDLPLLPLFDQLVSMFTTHELIRWPKMVEVYGHQLKQQSVFSGEGGSTRWEDLRQRIIEHNIRVIARFYTRISIQGLSELLDLSLQESEEVLTSLVVKGMVYARIDRPKRTISFAKQQSSDDVLNEWSNNTAKLLEHVETVCHLISKEEMLHGIKA